MEEKERFLLSIILTSFKTTIQKKGGVKVLQYIISLNIDCDLMKVLKYRPD